MCTVTESYNIYIYFTFTLLFYFLFFILSCFHSPFSVSLSSLPLHLFFLPPQTLLSSSETHRQSTRAQPPQIHHHWPTFSRRPDPFRPLFSIFGVSSCACVLALCFRLCLCFGFVFRAGFLFRAVIFLLFFFFFTSFDGHGGVVVVQWFLWVWWWLWL